MMKNVIRMLGQTSEIIYQSGVDCTPYPSGDFSLAQNLDNRNEYGSNSEFIPTEEKDVSGALSRVPLRDDSRRKRKWNNPFTSCSDGVESQIDIPSVISARNSQQNRVPCFGHLQPYFLRDDYDKENVNNQKSVCSGYLEGTFSEKRACNDYQAQSNAVRFKAKTMPQFGIQERNVIYKYNPSVSPILSDLQTDLDLKMKWTRKKPKSSTKARFRKSWRSSTSKPNMQHFCNRTPEQFKHLQCVRETFKDLVDDKSSRKGKHSPLGHEKQLRKLPEQSFEWSNVYNEKPLTIGQISKNDFNFKGVNEGKERIRSAVLSNIRIPVAE